MEPIIELQGLNYRYQPDSDRQALTNVSTTIYRGEWIAVIGHNGSGKSTLAKAINGLIVPQEGTVLVDGLPMNEENVWNIRKKIGMVFQNPDNQFVGATVEDDVAFGLENQGVPHDEMVALVEASLEKVRMLAFREKEPARLSGGQKQRVAIAGVVALSPDVIILDEATSMLDPKGRFEVINTIQKLREEKQLTVISITHDIDEAANANRILVMKQGELIKEGSPEEIFTAGERLIEMGLDLPFPEKLKLEMAKVGLDVPAAYMSEEGMVEWLWTSNLNK
ncbi:energy-coupling factor ABC transporter ATP-binding protein [Vagococcus lutrae]|uniref:energy-coupling factor ABC transporter ATP-binding protein n=1 Tax=Vagococcus lutrae TaxID=81947 RepID=UPI000F898242|nr:energy-coupling factor ABC transporter ATP-binding protein [Vagococcus lutrae]MCO7150386.1 energy-coupling factor ABC transporter ATP-binding protein [Vagococcus lutrae]MDT2811756.1 energy-coupling factor ABC transporter ATP-binding protein [Vagococcus lutrae]MDT2818786.1 energy-coupling factor ABC transporter ATP-binding protein [Vagococcus lutrae]MDT2824184.1 energy-coupling factor ABC transporter ATP-binding protein [Vagococcus lutrae]MDT2826436.1 energy-coupling factor ABC transporter A